MNPLYYVKCIMYSSFGFSKCALKGQQRLAQGKRSDTLGQSTFVCDALKGQKLYTPFQH